MRPRFRTYEDIRAQQIATLRVKTGVNLPLYAGDAMLALLEAGALSDADQYVQALRMARALSLESAEKDELDDRSLEFGTPRLQAVKARVTGHFDRVVGSAGLINIPIGTTVFVPATPTIAAIEFTTLSATSIAALSASSPDITVEAVEAGTRSNGVPPGASLTLKNTIANVQAFVTATTSAGGLDKELDAELRARARRAPQDVALATKTALEGAVRRISLVGGGAVTSFRVIENFRTGVTEIYIDDGSGNVAQIGPTIASQTYRYTAQGGEIYVRAEQLTGITPGASRENLAAGFPFVVITSVTRDLSPYGAPVIQVLGGPPPNGYFVDQEAGIFAFATPLQALARVDVIMTTYGGLVEEAAKVVRGIPGNPSYPGTRGASLPFLLRPPTSLTTATVTGTLSVDPGYDGAFARSLTTNNIRAYINSFWGTVRFARLIDIAMDTPGATNFVMTTPTGDIAPTSETGVVRAGTISIS